jgi:hypothetical protein
MVIMRHAVLSWLSPTANSDIAIAEAAPLGLQSTFLSKHRQFFSSLHQRSLMTDFTSHISRSPIVLTPRPTCGSHCPVSIMSVRLLEAAVEPPLRTIFRISLHVYLSLPVRFVFPCFSTSLKVRGTVIFHNILRSDRNGKPNREHIYKHQYRK